MIDSAALALDPILHFECAADAACPTEGSPRVDI